MHSEQYSRPSVPTGIGFRNPQRTQKPSDAQVPSTKWHKTRHTVGKYCFSLRSWLNLQTRNPRHTEGQPTKCSQRKRVWGLHIIPATSPLTSKKIVLVENVRELAKNPQNWPHTQISLFCNSVWYVWLCVCVAQ